MFEQRDYRQILKGELERRCLRNRRYSLRAFARDLDLSSARLSEILNSKTGLSREKAETVCSILGFNDEEKEFFCNLVESEHARSKTKRELAQARLTKYQAAQYNSLEVDHFKAISDWYHFAILELMNLKRYQCDPRWIASALKIQEIEAKLALERLERLGLITKKRNKYVPTESFSSAQSAVPSEAIRNFHRQILQKALDSVDLQSMERRELGAVVMAIDEKDLPRIRERVRDFRRALNQEFTQTQEKNSVYCLATQFFELSNEIGANKS